MAQILFPKLTEGQSVKATRYQISCDGDQDRDGEGQCPITEIMSIAIGGLRVIFCIVE